MKYKKSVFQSLAQITQFGLYMIIPILLCTFIGIWLDRWLNTSFLVIIFFFLGAVAGGRNIYIFSKQIYEKDTHSPYESRRKQEEKEGTWKEEKEDSKKNDSDLGQRRS